MAIPTDYQPVNSHNFLLAMVACTEMDIKHKHKISDNLSINAMWMVSIVSTLEYVMMCIQQGIVISIW